MKKALLLLIACAFLLQAYTQICFTPFGCGKDLRDSFFYLHPNQIATNTSNYAKVGAVNGNYKDVLYGKSFGDCTSGIDSTTCTNDTAKLRYIAYYPSTINYDSCKQPAIIIIHGGGFQDCGVVIQTMALYAFVRSLPSAA